MCDWTGTLKWGTCTGNEIFHSGDFSDGTQSDESTWSGSHQSAQICKQKIRVGYAPTCGVAYPATESADDIAAAKKVYFGFENPMDNWTWNVAWFSDPVF